MHSKDRPDSEVIRKVQEGDVDEFALLVRKYQSLAYGLAFSLAGDFATAEDICQDAFIAAYRNLGRLREPERFAPWLKRIVRNTATDYLRGAGRMQLALENKVVAGQIQKSSDTGKQNPEEDEFARQIRDVLMQLPEKARTAVSLRYMDDFTYQSAAEFLGIKVGTFKKRLHDGRRLLQREIVKMAERTFQEHRLPRGFAARCLCGCKQSSSEKPLKLQKGGDEHDS